MQLQLPGKSAHLRCSYIHLGTESQSLRYIEPCKLNLSKRMTGKFLHPMHNDGLGMRLLCQSRHKARLHTLPSLRPLSRVKASLEEMSCWRIVHIASPIPNVGHQTFPPMGMNQTLLVSSIARAPHVSHHLQRIRPTAQSHIQQTITKSFYQHLESEALQPSSPMSQKPTTS